MSRLSVLRRSEERS